VTINISEIFPSLQGEGVFTGLPTTFIRFAGCNFCESTLDSPPHPCKWCDSPTSWYQDRGKHMSVEQILNEVGKIGIKRVCITGGEPLFQREGFKLLCRGLVRLEYWIEIETNGSLPPYMWTPLHWVVDMKCPSSGNDKYNEYLWLAKLRSTDQVKFVVQDRQDFEFALSVLKEHPTKARILFSPVWEKLDGKELAQWLIDERLDKYRLSMQVHKWLKMK